MTTQVATINIVRGSNGALVTSIQWLECPTCSDQSELLSSVDLFVHMSAEYAGVELQSIGGLPVSVWGI